MYIFFLDIGALSEDFDFGIHCLFMQHYYSKGSLHPTGGSNDIIKSLASTI